MPLLQVIGLLLCVALIYWLIEKYAPANQITQILKAVIVIVTVLFLMDLFFDLRGALTRIRVGR